MVDDPAGAGRGGDWGLLLPARDLFPSQPPPHASRSTLFSRAGGVRPDPMGGPTRGWPRPAGLSAFWWGAASVPRRRICVDGRAPGADDAGADVAHGAGARPSRGALGAGDPATATGQPSAPDSPVPAWPHAPWRDGTGGGRMSDGPMRNSPDEAPGAGTPRTRRRLPLRIAEVREV